MSDTKPRASIKLPSDFVFGELRPDHAVVRHTCTAASPWSTRRICLEIGSETASIPSSGPTVLLRRPHSQIQFHRPLLPATTS